MLLPLGVVLVLVGVAGVVIGLRGLWVHREAFANIRIQPLKEDHAGFEAAREGLDSVVQGLTGEPGFAPLDALAGAIGLAKMPKPLLLPGTVIFVGVILIITGALFVAG